MHRGSASASVSPAGGNQLPTRQHPCMLCVNSPCMSPAAATLDGTLCVCRPSGVTSVTTCQSAPVGRIADGSCAAASAGSSFNSAAAAASCCAEGLASCRPLALVKVLAGRHVRGRGGRGTGGAAGAAALGCCGALACLLPAGCIAAGRRKEWELQECSTAAVRLSAYLLRKSSLHETVVTASIGRLLYVKRSSIAEQRLGCDPPLVSRLCSPVPSPEHPTLNSSQSTAW